MIGLVVGGWGQVVIHISLDCLGIVQHIMYFKI